MSRGKYARRSAHQNTLAENQERADTAERLLKNVTMELAEYRKQAEAKILDLEDLLQDARSQRDSAASPKIAELEARNAELNELCRKHDEQLKKREKTSKDAFVVSCKLLRVVTGCTGLEATEAIFRVIGPDAYSRVTLSEFATHSRTFADVDGTRIVQRSQGWRSSPSIVNRLDEIIQSVQALEW